MSRNHRDTYTASKRATSLVTPSLSSSSSFNANNNSNSTNNSTSSYNNHNHATSNNNYESKSLNSNKKLTNKHDKSHHHHHSVGDYLKHSFCFHNTDTDTVSQHSNETVTNEEEDSFENSAAAAQMPTTSISSSSSSVKQSKTSLRRSLFKNFKTISSSFSSHSSSLESTGAAASAALPHCNSQHDYNQQNQAVSSEYGSNCKNRSLSKTKRKQSMMNSSKSRSHSKSTEKDDKRSISSINWSNLDDYDQEDFAEAFRIFDTNGDGRITAHELSKVLNELGIKVSKHDAELMIADIDNDGNGTIEYSEFVQMMTQPASREADEYELREAFKCIDLDGNGYISREELRGAVKKIMSTDKRISVQDVEEMMIEADQDNNGLIDFDEFVRILVEKRN